MRKALITTQNLDSCYSYHSKEWLPPPGGREKYLSVLPTDAMSPLRLSLRKEEVLLTRGQKTDAFDMTLDDYRALAKGLESILVDWEQAQADEWRKEGRTEEEIKERLNAIAQLNSADTEAMCYF
jgi:hypothetical protein